MNYCVGTLQRRSNHFFLSITKKVKQQFSYSKINHSIRKLCEIKELSNNLCKVNSKVK